MSEIDHGYLEHKQWKAKVICIDNKNWKRDILRKYPQVESIEKTAFTYQQSTIYGWSTRHEYEISMKKGWCLGDIHYFQGSIAEIVDELDGIYKCTEERCDYCYDPLEVLLEVGD